MNIFKEYRKKFGLTQIELAEKLNITQTAVSKWEKNITFPDLWTLQNLAEIYNVSIEVFLKNNQNYLPKAPLEKEVEAIFARIPVYGIIPAGIPADMIEDRYIEDYEDIDKKLLKGGAKYFGLKVKGESMMPEFRERDTLIIKQQDDCNSGDFCAVSINHTECTFKKVIKKENGITLQPLNPNFEPMFFTNEEIEKLPITILGVVKEVRRSY